MKIITLWQPWASAIAFGWKRNETRSWSTNYRGAIAIHAGLAGSPKAALQLAQEVNASAGHPELLSGRRAKDWVFGAIVAIATVAGVLPSEVARKKIGRLERAWGVYDDGRFAWALEDVHAVEPLPYTGAQGLRDLEREVEASLVVLNRVDRLILK